LLGSLLLILVLLIVFGALIARMAVLLVRYIREPRPHVPSPSGEREPWLQIGRFRVSFGGFLLIALLIALWSRGTFDHTLVNVGLNAKECARNGFGATFCGDELDRYRRQVIDPLNDTPGR
jgi:hypothetical protein